MKFDIVKLGDNRYGVKVRYYVRGIKLFTEFVKITNDAEAPLTKRFPHKNEEQSEKTDFENIYTGTKDQCTKLYCETIDDKGHLYKSILAKIEDWDLVGNYEMGSASLFLMAIILLITFIPTFFSIVFGEFDKIIPQIISFFPAVLAVSILSALLISLPFIVNNIKAIRKKRLKERKQKNKIKGVDIELFKFDTGKYGVKVTYKICGVFKIKPEFAHINFDRGKDLYKYFGLNRITYPLPATDSEREKFIGTYEECCEWVTELVKSEYKSNFLKENLRSRNSSKKIRSYLNFTMVLLGLLLTGPFVLFPYHFDLPPFPDTTLGNLVYLISIFYWGIVILVAILYAVFETLPKLLEPLYLDISWEIKEHPFFYLVILLLLITIGSFFYFVNKFPNNLNLIVFLSFPILIFVVIRSYIFLIVDGSTRLYSNILGLISTVSVLYFTRMLPDSTFYNIIYYFTIVISLPFFIIGVIYVFYIISLPLKLIFHLTRKIRNLYFKS